MSAGIRRQVFIGMVIQTGIVIVGIMTILLCFNIEEQREHPELAEEEAREFLLAVGTVALCLPLAGVTAWLITRRLLSPLLTLTRSVSRVRSDNMVGRLDVPDDPSEIRELALGLNDAFDRYEHVLANLDRFCYDAAHQLKNPLGAMRIGGEVCLEQERSPEDYRETIGILLEQTGRLSHTVDQLLVLARLDRDQRGRQFTRLSLTELTQEVVDDASPAIESKSLSLERELPDDAIAIYGMPDLLREALANLIDNAVKFTPEGGRIAIRLDRSNINTATLIVEDSGPGIPGHRAGRIFAPFERGHTKPTQEGTGLGLAITANITRIHRGTINLRPGKLGGACFALRLPTA